MSKSQHTLCVLTCARKATPNCSVVSSINLQFLRTTAASMIAAGACTSPIFLPTYCSCNDAPDVLGYSELAMNGWVVLLMSETTAMTHGKQCEKPAIRWRCDGGSQAWSLYSRWVSRLVSPHQSQVVLLSYRSSSSFVQHFHDHFCISKYFHSGCRGSSLQNK